jgi:predicted DNA-binding protein (UPF0251 family)
MRNRGRGRGRGGGGGQGWGRGWRHGQRDRGPPEVLDIYGPRAILLTFDELEALRLVDLEGLYQEEAARALGISRRTLWSDLKNARRKVVIALLNGQPIRIVGGSHVIPHRGPGDRPMDGAQYQKGHEEE